LTEPEETAAIVIDDEPVEEVLSSHGEGPGAKEALEEPEEGRDTVVRPACGRDAAKKEKTEKAKSKKKDDKAFDKGKEKDKGGAEDKGVAAGKDRG